jgi:hypothetical protein
MRSEIQIPCYLYFVQLFSWAFGRRCTTILFIQKEVNSWILFVKAMNIVLWYFLVGSIFFWLPSDAVLVFYKSNFEKHEHLLAGKKKKKKTAQWKHHGWSTVGGKQMSFCKFCKSLIISSDTLSWVFDLFNLHAGCLFLNSNGFSCFTIAALSLI